MNTSVEKKKSIVNTTAIIAWVICFLVWLIVWIFVQQLVFQKLSNDCTIPLKLDWNLQGQNLVQ